jgi:hypothetical protein
MKYLLLSLFGLILILSLVWASDSTVLGDTLYGVKVIKEDLKQSLTFSSTSKAKLEAQIAQERLWELSIISGRNLPEGNLILYLARDNAYTSVNQAIEDLNKAKIRSSPQAAASIDRIISTLSLDASSRDIAVRGNPVRDITSSNPVPAEVQLTGATLQIKKQAP